MLLPQPNSTLFPYTTLFRSGMRGAISAAMLTALDDLGMTPAFDVVYGCSSGALNAVSIARSEEHTSELQSRPHLVCRLLLEKKKVLSQQHFRQFTLELPSIN